jgi:hypothetical protein
MLALPLAPTLWREALPAAITGAGYLLEPTPDRGMAGLSDPEQMLSRIGCSLLIALFRLSLLTLSKSFGTVGDSVYRSC